MVERSDRQRIALEGTILGVGFASGDRFVVGLWDDGPLGAMNDVMWARPDGTRVLIAPTPDAARFVGGIYDFDEVRTARIDVARSEGRIAIRAEDVSIGADLGAPARFFRLRPSSLRRSLAWVRFEDALARPLVARFLLGGAKATRAYGRTRSGLREWYRIDSYRPVLRASGSVAGDDLGSPAPLAEPARFGFSEFPPRPAAVGCAPVLEGPAGWVDDLLGRERQRSQSTSRSRSSESQPSR